MHVAIRDPAGQRLQRGVAQCVLVQLEAVALRPLLQKGRQVRGDAIVGDVRVAGEIEIEDVMLVFLCVALHEPVQVLGQSLQIRVSKLRAAKIDTDDGILHCDVLVPLRRLLVPCILLIPVPLLLVALPLRLGALVVLATPTFRGPLLLALPLLLLPIGAPPAAAPLIPLGCCGLFLLVLRVLFLLPAAATSAHRAGVAPAAAAVLVLVAGLKQRRDRGRNVHVAEARRPRRAHRTHERRQARLVAALAWPRGRDTLLAAGLLGGKADLLAPLPGLTASGLQAAPPGATVAAIGRGGHGRREGGREHHRRITR
mmetsp:Transcript_20350/g.70487  ORF Transcript_20350/g.70487 Transcript_20350/m.70487 type:complete len:313 (+) Transcript_20350:2219-3157(+)